MRTFLVSLLGSMAVLLATTAPATPKPCRDQHGKIIPCEKPKLKPAPTRCKDEKGRFIPCKKPDGAGDRG